MEGGNQHVNAAFACAAEHSVVTHRDTRCRSDDTVGVVDLRGDDASHVLIMSIISACLIVCERRSSGWT